MSHRKVMELTISHLKVMEVTMSHLKVMEVTMPHLKVIASRTGKRGLMMTMDTV